MKIPIKQYLDLLTTYLRPQWPRVVWLGILLLGGIGLQLANPQILRRFIDAAVSGAATAGASQDTTQLLVLAGLFMGLALVQQLATVAATYFSENIAWTATNAMRAELSLHCINLDMAFHNLHTPGEMIERLDGDVTTLSNFFSQFVVQLLGSVLLLIGILVLMWREDWRIGLTLCVFVAVAIVSLNALRRWIGPHFVARSKARAALFGFLEERLAGLEDIRSNGAAAYVLRRFFELSREVFRQNFKSAASSNNLINVSWVLYAGATAAAFVLSARLFQSNAMTLGSAYLVFYYTALLSQPLDRLTNQLQDLQQAEAGIVRVRELMNTSNAVVDGVEPDSSTKGALALTFDDVSFQYAAVPNETTVDTVDERVLRHVSFQLRPGQVLGLLGRTGSGKTTITRLIFRLYDLTGGSICLGDGEHMTDIRHMRLADLRRRVGIVTQDVQLFHASVRDNLTWFDRSIADARIIGVLEDLGLGRWFAALPNGLETELQSGGKALSAGEAQLLAFARVFLSDPGLVILDEASSRLDPATEQLIERAITRLLQGSDGHRQRSAIIIAHRLATVQRADDILMLEHGQISEYGSRLDLVNDPQSRFAQLLRMGLEQVLA